MSQFLSNLWVQNIMHPIRTTFIKIFVGSCETLHNFSGYVPEIFPSVTEILQMFQGAF